MPKNKKPEEIKYNTKVSPETKLAQYKFRLVYNYINKIKKNILKEKKEKFNKEDDEENSKVYDGIKKNEERQKRQEKAKALYIERYKNDPFDLNEFDNAPNFLKYLANDIENIPYDKRESYNKWLKANKYSIYLRYFVNGLDIPRKDEAQYIKWFTFYKLDKFLIEYPNFYSYNFSDDEDNLESYEPKPVSAPLINNNQKETNLFIEHINTVSRRLKLELLKDKQQIYEQFIKNFFYGIDDNVNNREYILDINNPEYKEWFRIFEIQAFLEKYKPQFNKLNLIDFKETKTINNLQNKFAIKQRTYNTNSENVKSSVKNSSKLKKNKTTERQFQFKEGKNGYLFLGLEEESDDDFGHRRFSSFDEETGFGLYEENSTNTNLSKTKTSNQFRITNNIQNAFTKAAEKQRQLQKERTPEFIKKEKKRQENEQKQKALQEKKRREQVKQQKKNENKTRKAIEKQQQKNEKKTKKATPVNPTYFNTSNRTFGY